MQKEHCHLCGNLSKLSFDHVPPRAAFNKQTRYKEIPILDYLKVENPLNSQFRGQIKQGGLGYYSLCRNCNSFLGTNYTSDYIKYSNSFIQFAKKKEFNCFEIEMHNFNAAKVLKQIAGMFISLNPWDYLEHYPDLRSYVANLNYKDLPDRYRFFVYLNTVGQLRNSPFSVVGDLKTGKSILASEISFPPLGHVMTVDFSGSLPHHFEITNFKDFGVDELTSVVFKIYRLETHLPFPLDYRQKFTIESTITNSNKC